MQRESIDPDIIIDSVGFRFLELPSYRTLHRLKGGDGIEFPHPHETYDRLLKEQEDRRKQRIKAKE